MDNNLKYVWNIKKLNNNQFVHWNKFGVETISNKFLVNFANNYKKRQVTRWIKCEILKQKNWNQIV